MKMAIILISLVEEAQELSDSQIEAEIAENIEPAKIPWAKNLVKVMVFKASTQNASSGRTFL